MNIPGSFLTWFGLMGGVWALFDRAETVVSKESKKKVTAWIKGLEISSRKDLPQTFVDAFNAVFGRRHFSLRCIFSSVIASFSFVVILQILFMSLNPPKAKMVLENPSIFFSIFFTASILNLVPDYFSLLETRLILRAMTKASSTWRILILIIADFILTTVIMIVAFVGVSLLFDATLAVIAENCRLGLEFRTAELGDINFGIFFYTTFLTSFWIWLYVLALIIARIVVRLGRVWSWFKGVLNFTEKPLRSLGFLSMILVTVIYILILMA